VLLAALLCAEGALSLAGAPTLGARLRPVVDAVTPAPVRLLGDAERLAAEGDDGEHGGIYVEHPDPLVRYVLRPDSAFRILDGTVSTNALGLRRRPGPPAAEGAVRLVVLGDSVAFGYGVDDDQTLAARLEQHLAASLGPAARPVACHTVAVPSWNHRAAVAALTDHWDAYEPGIVVYVPVPNDLSDANSVLSTGQMRLQPDPTAADPWLVVSRSRLGSLEAAFETHLRARGRAPADIAGEFGPTALEADIAPESSRRYDENAASIAALERLVRARGGRLLVALATPGAYAWHLLDRLGALAPDLAVLMLERVVPPEHTLGVNNHPNAATLDARATWIARELLARGWVDPGEARPLPDVPSGYAALRGPAPAPHELRERAAAAREHARESLHHELDLRSGRGLRQVYGGLNHDTTAGTALMVLLRAAGPRLQLRLAPLPTRPDLYPLDVDVDVDGRPIGRVSLAADGVQDADLALPDDLAPGSPIEVRLRPGRWCVIHDEGRAQVASFQPVRIAAPPSP
jgi:hypothetical protein